MAKCGWVFAAAWLWLSCLASNAPAATRASGQVTNPYLIDTWTTDDGLPQNTVTSIIQTRDGYLWFGTRNGLVRFNGIQFTVFNEGNTPGLNSSGIAKLFEDSQGGLWVGTEAAGVELIRQGQIESLGIGLGGFERRLASICEDVHGAVWLYTMDGQLWRYANGRYQVFVADRNLTNDCRVIISEQAGRVWVGAKQRQDAITPGLDPGSLKLPVEESIAVANLDYLLASKRGGYWRLANGHIWRCKSNRDIQEVGTYQRNIWLNPITAACEDAEGNLVIGTPGDGIFWFGADGKRMRLSTDEGLSNNVVLALFADQEGSIWVGTDGGGLNRVKRLVFEVLDVAQNSAAKSIQSVCEDAEGGLWLGSNGGGVAYRKGSILERYIPEPGLASYVWSVFVDQQQRVWAGTWGGLFQWVNGKFQRVAAADSIHWRIHAIHQDRKGQMWLGLREGLVRWNERDWKLFTTKDGLSANDVQAIADDRQGNLWVGTAGGGLNRLRDGQSVVFHKKDGVPGEDISALYVDADDVLWIGTFGGGLGRFHHGHWARFTTHEGLTSDSINYLVEDRQGYFWIGSFTGIMRVRKQELHDYARNSTNSINCRAYGKSDGLLMQECTSGSQPSGCLARDGRIWLPTTKGVVSVDPLQLSRNTNPPPVIIETVLIDGQPQGTNALLTGWAQKVVVPAGKEHLEIHYASLNLGAAERSRFKYRLEGHETRWIEAYHNRVAHYTKLPPGHYRFQVRACNEDGVWNTSGSGFDCLVETPLWRTGWFLSALTAGLLGCVITAVHYYSTQKIQRELERVAHREALEKERSRIAQDIHDQLGANLTTVSLLTELLESDKDQPAEVQAHARQISQTARDTTRVLDEIVWAVNPSNDTLEGLITYMCKYAQDFLSTAGLRYRLDVPAQLPATGVPPEFRHHFFLTFKESLTNVVRHAAATSVLVRLRLESATFILEVEDDGRGLAGWDEKAAQTRNGLRNMRKRMESMGGSFAFGPAPTGGALVRLTAPLQPKGPANGTGI